jgi:hypothetical protein
MNIDYATLVSYSDVEDNTLLLGYYIVKTSKFTGYSATRSVQKFRAKQSRRVKDKGYLDARESKALKDGEKKRDKNGIVPTLCHK